MAKSFSEEVQNAAKLLKAKKSTITEDIEDKESFEIIIGLVAIVSGIKEHEAIFKTSVKEKNVIYVEFHDRAASKYVSTTIVNMVNAAKKSKLTMSNNQPNAFISFMKSISAKESKKFFGLGKSTLEIRF